MEEIWRDAVRKGSILYDQMNSGCFPDKQNPITYPELLAQGWTVNDAAGPEIQFPPPPGPPTFGGNISGIMPFTNESDYYDASLKHIIGMLPFSPN